MSLPVLSSVIRTTATKASAAQISRSCLINSVTSSPTLSVVTSRGVGDFATRHGNDPEILERGKQKILDQHHPTSKVEAEWHEEVASDSEAFVKAIRTEVKHSDKDIEQLQKESEKVFKMKKEC